MIKRIIVFFAAAGLLAACVSTSPGRSFARAEHPDMFAALDTSPDGYEGTVRATGETFRIKSTHVNASRLCRLVEIRGNDTFVGESFCKIKGGEWR